MELKHIDTPAVLIDRRVMMQNLKDMQQKADEAGVALRPHTKTHKTPALAKLQVEAGARGITVAKVSEAEVMSQQGITDIFVANQIFGRAKFQRLKQIARQIKISVGVDSITQVKALSHAFAGEAAPIRVLIEIEVGEKRSGLLPGPKVVHLAQAITSADNVEFAGVFSHEGHVYGATDVAQCQLLFKQSQEDTLKVAQLITDAGIAVNTISIGATPSLLLGKIAAGITEIRPGTYIFLDAAQGHALGDYSRCAATVLATVVSKPTEERIVLDTGAKALTAAIRGRGICHTPGFGLLKHYQPIRLNKVYDEHGLINDRQLATELKLGDKVEIIPNHICPTCNLYDKLYLIDDGEVVQQVPILCRGRSQ